MARDALYRAALGLAGGEPLPRSLGNVNHSHAGQTQAQASGGAMRLRTRTCL